MDLLSISHKPVPSRLRTNCEGPSDRFDEPELQSITKPCQQISEMVSETVAGTQPRLYTA